MEQQDSQIVVKIKSAFSGWYINARGPVKKNERLFCRELAPLEFVFEGSLFNGAFRVKDDQNLYLDLVRLSGRVKLFDADDDARFIVQPLGNFFTLYNIKFKQYMCCEGDEIYITGSCMPNSIEALWDIGGLESLVQQEKELELAQN